MEPYIPDTLPLDNIDWTAHVSLIGKANAALARYDGILQGIVNPEILLSPLTTREAVLSSRIEGTQASLEDVLQYEADSNITITPEKQADIQEIINYRIAMKAAVDDLQKRPLCINMVRDLHRILLTSTRGRDKEPGEIRRIQNYIAPPGTPIERATFVPPSPLILMDALSNWEAYFHSEEKDVLVQLSILKAQFELIHPFRDGNGRIGRMLVPLILYRKNMLSTPMFYISAYLERNRDEYYEHLLAISRDGNWNEWISFFLRAIVEQAEENSQKATHVLRLYDDLKHRVPGITRSKYSIQAIDAIFATPIFRPVDFIGHSDIPKESAKRILKELKNARVLEILRERRGRRPTVYVFPELIAICEGKGL